MWSGRDSLSHTHSLTPHTHTHTLFLSLTHSLSRTHSRDRRTSTVCSVVWEGGLEVEDGCGNNPMVHPLLHSVLLSTRLSLYRDLISLSNARELSRSLGGRVSNQTLRPPP